MTIHHCDKCGKEIAVYNRRTFMRRILYSNCYFDFLYDSDSYNHIHSNKDYELCKDCTEKLITFLESDKHE